MAASAAYSQPSLILSFDRLVADLSTKAFAKVEALAKEGGRNLCMS